MLLTFIFFLCYNAFVSKTGKGKAFFQNEDSGAKVAVIIFGQMRSFEATWPQIKEQIGVTSDRINVSVFVTTSLSSRCTEKSGCSVRIQNMTQDIFKRQIENAFYPHLQVLYETESRNLQKIYDFLDTIDDIQSFWKEFDHVLILRADVVFTKSFNLMETCVNYPGFNVIGGTIVRDCFWYHRDWDFGFLACEPSLIMDYFFPKS